MMKQEGQQALYGVLLRKILLIPIIFLVVSCATSTDLFKKERIKEGINKWAVNNVLAWRTFWDQILVPTAYREYFSKQKKEILSDESTRDVYYVFRNVNKLLCE